MIRVFGYVGTVTPDMSAAAHEAAVVVGGRRHLDALGVPDERRQVLGTIGPACERLLALREGQHGVVVASGDPLLFGVVRRLRQAGLAVRVTTAPSSIQLAFAAVALPWDDAKIVSAHGHDVDPTVELCRSHPKVAVLTAPGRGINELAKALADLGRWYVLAERLGETDERVRVLTTDEARAVEAASPNVVLVLAHHPDDPAALGGHPAVQGDIA